MQRNSDTSPGSGREPILAARRHRLRRMLVSLAVVGALAGCSGDDVDEGSVEETMLPTAPPATDPLDPSE